MNTLILVVLLDFNARENIFKPKIGNESLHQENNNNGIRIVNFATSKTSCSEHNFLTSKHSKVHLELSW